MKFQVNAKVMLKKKLLDVQGRAVESYLTQNQVHISQMRVGKCFEFVVESASIDNAKSLVKKTLDETLVNSLLEEYQFELKEM
ncbi:MAG: phosphoribosylformylglycinamidine synthase subunit PurS [Pseudobdellovibrionaceae bacterium]